MILQFKKKTYLETIILRNRFHSTKQALFVNILEKKIFEKNASTEYHSQKYSIRFDSTFFSPPKYSKKTLRSNILKKTIRFDSIRFDSIFKVPSLIYTIFKIPYDQQEDRPTNFFLISNLI